METLEKLFEDTLRDIYYAEKQIVKALPPKHRDHAKEQAWREGIRLIKIGNPSVDGYPPEFAHLAKATNLEFTEKLIRQLRDRRKPMREHLKVWPTMQRLRSGGGRANGHPKDSGRDKLQCSDHGEGCRIAEEGDQESGQQGAARVADVHDRALHPHPGPKPLDVGDVRDERGG